jgi:DNA helicase-2/ATP-dependent DNA helicase PcrA
MWLDELNEPQRRAATDPGGPLLVIAGAGSGKTKTLAARVAWLIQQGTPAERILLLTFTRRAAAEMLRRAGEITGQGMAGRVWGGTFHATANRLLRQYGRAVGLGSEFTVMDQADTADLMNLVRGDLGLGTGKRRFPQKSTLAGIYSRMVNSRAKLSDLVRKHYPWCHEELDGIRSVFQEYTQRKRRQNVLDYDDLLLFWHALLRSDTGPLLAGRFDHILVDEYQDTNVIQAEILQQMRPEGTPRNLMVVGDDAQSIYSFRAATVRNILDFPQQFPGAEVVTLDQNYRSTQPILDATNAVMADAVERFTKDLFTRRQGERKPVLVTCLDEAEQCDEVCRRVLARREEGMHLTEQVVLFRAGHHSDQLEVELTRRNIPFVKYGGLKFVEAAHVKDLLAFLRLLENPADDLSWFRILQLLDGIGPAAARKILQALDERAEGVPDRMSALLQRPPAVPTTAQGQFEGLAAALRECLGTPGGEALPLGAQVERIRKFYEPIFQRTYDYPQLRLRDLDQLEQIAAGYASRSQFLTDLTLDPPSSAQDLAGPPLLDEDFLILSTIHSAKGLEWKAVYLIHCADGVIPSDMATGDAAEIEEERRLLYVAMTRARDSLEIFFPLRYYFRPNPKGDRHSYAQLTRFITQPSLPLYDREGSHAAGEAPDAALPTSKGAEGIDSMLSDLWSG